MPQQYHATDRRTGLEVAVTGDFPDDPDDRIRIARTTTLFTRLLATILAMPQQTERREGFRAVETQLEVAEALLRGEMGEVQRLLRNTMEQMGITEEQLAEMQQQLRQQFADLAGADFPDLPPMTDGPPQPHDPEELERGPFRDALPDTPIELGPSAPDEPHATGESAEEPAPAPDEPDAEEPDTEEPEPEPPVAPV